MIEPPISAAACWLALRPFGRRGARAMVSGAKCLRCPHSAQKRTSELAFSTSALCQAVTSERACAKDMALCMLLPRPKA
jgi:hypothetical protein